MLIAMHDGERVGAENAERGLSYANGMSLKIAGDWFAFDTELEGWAYPAASARRSPFSASAMLLSASSPSTSPATKRAQVPRLGSELGLTVSEPRTKSTRRTWVFLVRQSAGCLLRLSLPKTLSEIYDGLDRSNAGGRAGRRVWR